MRLERIRKMKETEEVTKQTRSNTNEERNTGACVRRKKFSAQSSCVNRIEDKGKT